MDRESLLRMAREAKMRLALLSPIARQALADDTDWHGARMAGYRSRP